MKNKEMHKGFTGMMESQGVTFVDCTEYKCGTWYPIETAPVNKSVLIYLPTWEHYGPGIYRAILCDMGTGKRWHTTAWACGRDLPPPDWPEKWTPLPNPPEAEIEKP